MKICSDASEDPDRVGRYALDYRSEMGDIELWNRDGVAWFDAPRPRRLHRCWVQTKGFTDWFRGVLCPACNTGIGLLGDDPERLESAADYLIERGDYARGTA